MWFADLVVPDRERLKALVSLVPDHAVPDDGTHIESLNGDVFGVLVGGYIRFKGRIEGVSRATAKPLQEEYSYKLRVALDLGWETLDEKPLYCFPLFVSNISFLRSVECLLLHQFESKVDEFTRAGVLRMWLHPEDPIPQDIQWIEDFANSDPDTQDLKTIILR